MAASTPSFEASASRILRGSTEISTCFDSSLQGNARYCSHVQSLVLARAGRGERRTSAREQATLTPTRGWRGSSHDLLVLLYALEKVLLVLVVGLVACGELDQLLVAPLEVLHRVLQPRDLCERKKDIRRQLIMTRGSKQSRARRALGCRVERAARVWGARLGLGKARDEPAVRSSGSSLASSASVTGCECFG